MEQLQFAERLTHERRRCGLTQDQLAAHLGVTKAAVSKWERGACGVSGIAVFSD